MTPPEEDFGPERRDKISVAHALFDELVELSAERRVERLTELAGTDPSLGRLLRELLEADEAAPDGFCEETPSALLEVLTSHGESVPGSDLVAGSTVGPYRLLDLLGRGGMGEVWRAERADGQFEQEVALKLVLGGLVGGETVRRFLLERQILARLEDPGIARLLDGGVSDEGSPYFAMELVDGEPITEFAKEKRLDLDARVRLIQGAAEAVAAAHAELVVHRDLKPSNILVTPDGRVKLLDFGIAKLLETGFDAPNLTRATVLPMTPAYAAPEQIRGEPVTTATDVFALGAVLYELLAGQPPFVRRGGSSAALAEELERETLKRPSRVVAERRGGRRLVRRLAGDLDTIVEKTLRMDPRRRYPSAAALADDLGRFLARQPVLARPDSPWYRLRKFVARNRVASVAAVMASIAVLSGLGVSLWQAGVARASAHRARAEATVSMRVQEILVGLFDGADPSRTLGATLTARQILDEGARRLPRQLKNDPTVQATISEVFARTYRGLGLLDDARRFAIQGLELRRRLDGTGSLATAEAELTVTEVAVDRGEVTRTRVVLTALLARFDRELGPTSTQSLRARAALAQDCAVLGDREEAQSLLRQVIDAEQRLHGEDAAETIDAMNALADVLGDASQFAAADRLLQEAHVRLERSGGLRSPQAIRVETSRAEILDALSRHDEAEKLYRQVLAKSRKVLGSHHVYTAEILIKYGFMLANLNRIPESDTLLEEAADILRPLGHFDYGAAVRYLGYNALIEERFSVARERFAEAEQFFRSTVGEDNPLTWGALVAKAAAEMRTGRLAAAERDQREAIGFLSRAFGAESEDVRTPLVALGETLRREGRFAEAIATHQRCLALAIKHFGAGETLASAVERQQLAEDHLARHTGTDLSEARKLIDATVAYFRARRQGPMRLGQALAVSARLALAAGDRARAHRELQEAVRLLGAGLPPKAPSLVAARELLARL